MRVTWISVATGLLFLSSFVERLSGQLASCANRPCQNGGTCRDQPETLYGYNCACTQTWSGFNCDKPTNSQNQPIAGGAGIPTQGGNNNQPGTITNNPAAGIFGGAGNFNNFQQLSCLNGGYRPTSSGVCFCTNGFTGSRCEIPPQNANIQMNPCAKYPCRNNGMCKTLSNGGFTCVCTGQFFGPICEQQKSTQGSQNNGNHSRVLGISLGSILPVLFFICVIGLCVYCCCCRKKNQNPVGGNRNPSGLIGRFFNGLGGNRNGSSGAGSQVPPPPVFPMNGGGAHYPPGTYAPGGNFPAAPPQPQPPNNLQPGGGGYYAGGGNYYQAGGNHAYPTMPAVSYQQPQQSVAATATVGQLPDPDQVFKVSSPPSYEEMTKSEKPLPPPFQAL